MRFRVLLGFCGCIFLFVVITFFTSILQKEEPIRVQGKPVKQMQELEGLK